jgi:hypothetical protein
VKAYNYLFDMIRRVGPRSLLLYLSEFKIRLSQDRLLKRNYHTNAEKLIVFLTMGSDIVNGGLLSISSMYEETKKLSNIHGAETVMCTIPGDSLLLRYTRFENQNYIYRFPQVLSYFRSPNNLIIHIPEYSVQEFLENLTYQDRLRLSKIRVVHINMMIQNIEYLASMHNILELKRLGKLTCTTAHEKYSTRELSQRIGCPLYKFSVWVSPEKYHKKSYAEKEDLMIVSPDPHPKRSEVLRLIAKQFPHLSVQVIRNLTYKEYKETISRAKWALTFGEGLDGYFVETVFSGGISFSAYNSRFFTEDFKSLRTVYDDYEVLIKNICSDIKDLDNEKAYAEYQNREYNLCSKYYSYREYVDNLKSFYKAEYASM